MAYMKRGRNRFGITTVEMAIVLPLLILLTFGLIEYGWLFLKAQEVTNATRQGARVAVLPYSTNDDVFGAIAPLMESAGLADSGYTVALTPGDVATAPSHTVVRVEITIPYANVTLIGVPLIPTPANLRAAVTMAKEGP